MKKLVKNALIVTMNKKYEVLENASLVYENNLITDIIKDSSIIDFNFENNFDEVIDASDKILLPTFTNTHAHLGMVGFRSLVDGIKNRLKTIFFPFEQNFMTRDLVYKSSKIACAEMLLNGISNVVDMYYYEDEVFKAVDEFKMRGSLGASVVNFKVCDMNGNMNDFKLIEDYLKKYQGNSRVRPIVAPHSLYQNSIKSLQKSIELTNEYDLIWTMHLSEMDFEIKDLKEKYNLTPIEYLDKYNLLNDRLIAAHCVIVTDNDIDILQKNDVNVSHCPISNAKSGRIVAPILKMLDKGINITLGTDGPSSLNALDLFETIKMAGYIHKCVNHDTTALESKELIKMVTINSAKALRLDDIGSIEIGKKADFMLLETDSPNMIPIFDIYSVLAYSTQNKNVDTVVVDGNTLVKNKKLLYIDMQKIKTEFYDELQEFSERANYELKKLNLK